MRRKNIFLIFIYLILLNCGFELANIQSNFNIDKIETTGDKRINYKLKTKILNKVKSNAKNIIELDINSKKIKSIKEKNTSNQITKYEINIITLIKYKSLTNTKEGEFTLSKKGDYNVFSKYSDTLNEEKNLINILLQDLSDDILETLIINIDDN